MVSDGNLKDISSRLDVRGLAGDDLTRCQQLLSAVPGRYTSLNQGLQTLQFQGLSVNPNNSKNIQGGTQDNGTFEPSGSSSNGPRRSSATAGSRGATRRIRTSAAHVLRPQPEVSFGTAIRRHGTTSATRF